MPGRVLLRMRECSSGSTTPPSASTTSWAVPLAPSFFHVYHYHLDLIWAILRLVGLHSSSWISLWTQCGSNLEISNLNNLHLDLIFGLHLSLTTCDPSHHHALGHAYYLMDGQI